MRTRSCRHCGDPVRVYYGKPGRIDECELCAVDVPLLTPATMHRPDALADCGEIDREMLGGMA